MTSTERPQEGSDTLKTKDRILKRSFRISYCHGALTTRSNYKKNWYDKTFPHKGGALKWYAKNFLRDVQGWIC